MKFTFTCKKIPLNDSIKEYAEKKINKLDRYFPEEAEAFVTFAVEKKNRPEKINVFEIFKLYMPEDAGDISKRVRVI